MNGYPPLGILILTYNRKDILRATLNALRAHVAYSGEHRYVVCDDGSDDGTQSMLREEFPYVMLLQNNRVGLGAQENAGLLNLWSICSPYVLQLQDDMALTQTLFLDPWVRVLEKHETLGYVRLWGVGGHRYRANFEGDGEIGVSWWRIDWRSDELYIPSDRPHLKHARFHRMFGMYPEGLKTAETEDAFCHQCKVVISNVHPTVDVVVPHCVDVEKNWEHLGWHSRWRDSGL